MMLCVFDVTWCAFVMMWCVFKFCNMLLSTCVHLFIMVLTFVSMWCAIVIVYCTFVLMFCYFIILHSENNWRIKIMFGILVIWTRLILDIFLLPSVRQTLVLPLFLVHDRNGLHMEKWCALHSGFEYSVRTSFLIFNSKSCFSDWNITIEWFYNDKPR